MQMYNASKWNSNKFPDIAIVYLHNVVNNLEVQSVKLINTVLPQLLLLLIHLMYCTNKLMLCAAITNCWMQQWYKYCIKNAFYRLTVLILGSTFHLAYICWDVDEGTKNKSSTIKIKIKYEANVTVLSVFTTTV